MQNQAASTALSPQDEHIIAALAHISILLPLIGIIAPIVIWITQKERSRFVAFQALQAIVYQLALILIWFVGIACYMASFFVSFFGTVALQSSSPNGPPLAFFLPFALMILLFAVMGIFVIYGIVAAVLTFQGKDFRYVLVGRWVERYTQQAAAQ